MEAARKLSQTSPKPVRCFTAFKLLLPLFKRMPSTAQKLHRRGEYTPPPPPSPERVLDPTFIFGVLGYMGVYEYLQFKDVHNRFFSLSLSAQ
jgi:hypothetical protein